MRGEKDRAAPVTVLGYDLQELLLHQRIQTRGRLIEHEQLGVVKQRLDQTDLLTIASRKLADRPIQIGFEPLRQQGSGPKAAHAASLGAELEELPTRQPRIAGEVTRKIAHPGANLAAPSVAVEAEQKCLAAGRMKQVEQGTDRRRLARAVGTKEPVHLASTDLD